MKMILIYATKPELRPLALVKDQSDVEFEIEWHLGAAKARHEASVKAAETYGGNVPTVALERWGSAKWVEVDISM
jgi:hypothetical protein